jgi:hypothetical protein
MSASKLRKDELLGQYIAAPANLEASLAGLSKAAFDLSRDNNKWTIREIVHHIIDSDAMVTAMIMAGLGNSGCTYDQTWYPTDNSWVETLAYSRRSLDPALALFRENHRSVEELIGLLPDSWARYVMFRWEGDPDGAKITVGDLINSRSHHAQHHIGQIQATRKAHGL